MKNGHSNNPTVINSPMSGTWPKNQNNCRQKSYTWTGQTVHEKVTAYKSVFKELVGLWKWKKIEFKKKNWKPTTDVLPGCRQSGNCFVFWDWVKTTNNWLKINELFLRLIAVICARGFRPFKWRCGPIQCCADVLFGNYFRRRNNIELHRPLELIKMDRMKEKIMKGNLHQGRKNRRLMRIGVGWKRRSRSRRMATWDWQTIRTAAKFCPAIHFGPVRRNKATN